MADRETGTPVDSSTLFRWASISKPLTAVAAMQLVEAGRLDLDADVRTLVPEFSAKATPIGTPVTMRQLLAHLGGIVHCSNGPVVRTVREYEQANPYQSVILALDTFAESPLVNQPGKKFAYTTHGYILASAVVERAGGAAYADQVIERICKPLGLTTLQPDYQWISIPDRAVGYRKIAGVVVPTTNTDVSWKLGGGGWISNIHDLAAFGAGMLGDAVLSAESRKTMWTRQQTIAGEQLGYGLGWDVSEPNERLRVAHNGSQEKTQTRLVLYPDDAHGIAVMTNSEYAKPGAITTAIYRAIEQWEVQQP
jgi:CubicO group peptidase (beta-lactamase class C family)